MNLNGSLCCIQKVREGCVLGGGNSRWSSSAKNHQVSPQRFKVGATPSRCFTCCIDDCAGFKSYPKGAGGMAQLPVCDFPVGITEVYKARFFAFSLSQHACKWAPCACVEFYWILCLCMTPPCSRGYPCASHAPGASRWDVYGICVQLVSSLFTLAARILVCTECICDNASEEDSVPVHDPLQSLWPSWLAQWVLTGFL